MLQVSPPDIADDLVGQSMYEEQFSGLISDHAINCILELSVGASKYIACFRFGFLCSLRWDYLCI